jgi:hypothetical protein
VRKEKVWLPPSAKVTAEREEELAKAFLPPPSKRVKKERTKALPSINEFLEPTETVVWRHTPARKTVFLQSLAGIWIGLFFGAFALAMLYTGVPLLGFPLVVLVFSCCIAVVPPVWFMKKYPSTEYALTNQRLIIKTGPAKSDVWSSEFGRIKGFIVKTGVSDKILGTGKLYPITPEYPYAPKIRSYTSGGMDRLRKVYNLTTGVFDQISESEIYNKSLSHPHLEGVEKPYEVQRFFTETIGAEPVLREKSVRISLVQKIGLALSVSMVVAGLLVFAGGYLTGYTPYVSFDNGFTYIDYVAIGGFGLIFPGIIALFLTFRSLVLSH